MQVTGIPKQLHGHRLVVSVAVEMAGEIYDKLMMDNEWYKRWKAKNPDTSNPRALERRFILKTAPSLFKDARATLASMLRQPIEQRLKDDITEALIADATIRQRAML